GQLHPAGCLHDAAPVAAREPGAAAAGARADRGRSHGGFFHPNCNAGGGGERVLWLAVRALQIEHGNKVQLFVYTGDLDAYKDSRGHPPRWPAAPAGGAHAWRGHAGPRLNPFRLPVRPGPDQPGRYPRLTLLRQSIGGAVPRPGGDRPGQPGRHDRHHGLPLRRRRLPLLRGCKTALPLLRALPAHLHRHDRGWSTPTQWRSTIPQRTRRSSGLAKLVYYRLFALLYGWFGRRWNLVMTNSSWTTGHIASLWGCQLPRLLYPPVYVKEFAHLGPDSLAGRLPIVLSVAQFSFGQRRTTRCSCAPSPNWRRKKSPTRPAWVLIGGCRNDEDSARVDRLRCLAEELSIERPRFDSSFNSLSRARVNAPHSELRTWLEKARIGLHSMRDEHFGIGIVDMMAGRADSHRPQLRPAPRWTLSRTTARLPCLPLRTSTLRHWSTPSAWSTSSCAVASRPSGGHIEKFAREKNFMPGFCQLTKPLIDYRGGEHVPKYSASDSQQPIRSKAEFLKLNICAANPLAWLHFCLPPLLILASGPARLAPRDLPLHQRGQFGADLTAALWRQRQSHLRWHCGMP
uniref:ALG11_N domain-containing protein n=1 Tax=Macrostomum lignano TaxID=282301 RepID=A0A1I8FEZ8_9PLAT